MMATESDMNQEICGDEEYPLVSIAIITYNQKDYLRECIESCLAQDYPNFEIVIADDGSTDGTQDMLEEYFKQYPGIFVLKLSETNEGITANSNIAHFACKGKYIAWMGGDDLMLPGKVSKQVKYMEANRGCTICYHNLEVFDSETGKILRYFNENLKINGGIREAIRYGTFNGACSNMVRADRAPIHGFDKSLPVASDWLYWVETLAGGGSIEYIDEVLGKYRRHSSNVTNYTKGLSRAQLDTIVACHLINFKYPEFSSYSLERMSNFWLLLRHKVDYRQAVLMSFCAFPKIKTLIRLTIFYLSFRRFKI